MASSLVSAAFHSRRSSHARSVAPFRSATAEVEANVGETMIDIAHENDIDIEGEEGCDVALAAVFPWLIRALFAAVAACGGELACSTCHVILDDDVYEMLGEISEEEEDMLDLAWGLTDTSRLCCQIKAAPELDGIVLKIPDEG